MINNKIFLFAAYICILMFGTNVADSNAYILRGAHILDLMTVNYGKAETLEIRQKRTFFPSEENQDIKVFQENIKFFFPEMFRAEIYTDKGSTIYVSDFENVIQIIGSEISSHGGAVYESYKDILLYRNRVILQEKLASLGVDLNITSLKRYKDSIVYIIGAAYSDMTVPQIWVDKETLRPVRWIIRGMGADKENYHEIVDAHYLKWNEKNGNWYPMHLEIYHGDKMLYDIKVEEVIVNAEMDEKLFDIAYLRSQLSPLVPEETPGEETPTLSEEEKLLENFEKRYE